MLAEIVWAFTLFVKIGLMTVASLLGLLAVIIPLLVLVCFIAYLCGYRPSD